MDKPDIKIDHAFLEEIKQLLQQARQGVLHQVNAIMVETYFEIGRRIVEQEQNGQNQAVYGSYLLETLSGTLTKEFGKGFSKRNLELIRKFYLTYRIAKSAISQSMSWTHYLQLDTLVEITLPEENSQIFASRYQTVLPSKEELKQLMDKRTD